MTDQDILQDSTERARAQTPAIEGTVPEWDIVVRVTGTAVVKIPFDTAHFGGATMGDTFRDLEGMNEESAFNLLFEKFANTPQGDPSVRLEWVVAQARHE